MCVPFFKGGGGGGAAMSGDVLPQKVLKFQSPKMQFSAFWGLN